MPRVPLNDLTLLGTTPPRFAVGAQVYVYDRGTTDEANVYAAEAGGAPVAQPLTVNAKGYTPGWVEEGQYDRVISGETFPFEAVSAAGAGLVASPFMATVLDDTTDTNARSTLGAASAAALAAHIADTTAHAISNTELAAATRASNVSLGNGIANIADITGLTVTYNAPASGIVEVVAYLPAVIGPADATLAWSITDGSNTQVGSGGGIINDAGADGSRMILARLEGLTPGASYTHKLRGYASAAGATLICAANSKATLRAKVA